MPAIQGPARYFFLRQSHGAAEEIPNWPPTVKPLEGADNLICDAILILPDELGWQAASVDVATPLGEHVAGAFYWSRSTIFGAIHEGKRGAATYELLGVRTVRDDGKGPDYATHVVVWASGSRGRAPLVAPVSLLVVSGYLEHRNGAEVALDLRLSPAAAADLPIYLPDDQVQRNADRALDEAVPTPRARHDMLVEVEAGRVSIHGRAELASTGDAAQAELLRTRGVVEVKDYLLYDEALVQQVSDALAAKGLSAINVLVEHNLVVLDGTVPDRKTFYTAKDTAQKIPGVRGVVVNQLFVDPSVKASDLPRTADLIPHDKAAAQPTEPPGANQKPDLATSR